jgi:hypothetical protein
MMSDRPAEFALRYEQPVGDTFASDLISACRRVVETPIAVLLDIDWLTGSITMASRRQLIATARLDSASSVSSI